MAELVYLDETGSVGKGAKRQNYLTIVAVIVDEDAVQPLVEGLREVAQVLGPWPRDGVEFHGVDLWHGRGPWKELKHAARLAAYESAIGLIGQLGLTIAHSTIDKVKLHQRYHGTADANAYLLGLQFLLEKIDRLPRANRIVIADEAKEQELRAVSMVADMQRWHAGEVPGAKLETVIDSLHFVRSSTSSGVQMADLVAYLRHRRQLHREEKHPDVEAARDRMLQVIGDHTRTYRQPWPR